MTIETANRLYELRKKNNLSQEELAEKLGVSRQAVSKWERSEASPDTDNLIALAKIYGLSLDELIYGEKSEQKQDTDEEANTNTEEDDDTVLINIKDGDDYVKIGTKGIVVEEKNGKVVTIGFNSEIFDKEQIKELIKDASSEAKNSKGESEGTDAEITIEKPRKKRSRFWFEMPYPIICVVAYLIFGFYNILGGWALSWVIFVTIPLYYSLIECIYKRRFSEFSYSVLAVFLYLVGGMYYQIWHPTWVIFVTIPIYYSIANSVDNWIARKRDKNR